MRTILGNASWITGKYLAKKEDGKKKHSKRLEAFELEKIII